MQASGSGRSERAVHHANEAGNIDDGHGIAAQGSRMRCRPDPPFGRGVDLE
jgi:hypothetical protein